MRLFDWFPPLGYAMLWEAPWVNVQQMIFPALVLAFFELNFTAHVTRSAMLEVLREDCPVHGNAGAPGRPLPGSNPWVRWEASFS